MFDDHREDPDVILSNEELKQASELAKRVNKALGTHKRMRCGAEANGYLIAVRSGGLIERGTWNLMVNEAEMYIAHLEVGGCVNVDNWRQSAGLSLESAVSSSIHSLDRSERSEWFAINEDPTADPLDRLSAWTPDHRVAVRSSVAGWCLTRMHADDALREIYQWSKRFGVALGIVVAKEALRYYGREANSPLANALAAADRWCRCDSQTDEHQVPLLAAPTTTYGEMRRELVTSSVREALSLIRGHRLRHLTGYYACMAYQDYAWAEGGRPSVVRRSTHTLLEHNVESRRLCQVIGEAMLTGPVADWIG